MKTCSHVTTMGLRLMVSVILVLAGIAGATPLTEKFTYQGFFKSGGVPMTGSHNFIFRLYAASSGGVALATQTRNGVTLVDGHATFNDLNFTGHFSGEQRWMEIQVDATTLVPRLELTASPYSTHSLNTRGINVDATGNIGIGTTTPAGDLHIVGNGDVILEEYGSNPTFNGRRARGTTAAPTAVSTGDVLAELVGAGYEGGTFSQEGFIRINAAEPWTPTAHGTDISFFTTTAGGIGTPERMRIDADGNVGIGTATPGAELDVAGRIQHSDSLDFVGAADAPILRIGTKDLIRRKTPNGAVLIGADDYLIIGDGESPDTVFANAGLVGGEEQTYLSSDNSLHFVTNLQGGWAGRKEMVFTDIGRLGIGSTSPASVLEVRGPGGDIGGVTGFDEVVAEFFNTNAGQHGAVSINSVVGLDSILYLAQSSTALWDLRADGSDSSFDIRLQGPTALNDTVFTLSAANESCGIGRNPASNRLEVEGNASKSASGSWLANSDRRIKKNIATIGSALETLNRVRLVSFEYADEYRAEHKSIEDRRYLNVIAQEFAEVFPEEVKGSGEKLPGTDEAILQVDTYPLTIYSAAAVQELHQLVKTQQAQIEGLNARSTELERMLSHPVSLSSFGEFAIPGLAMLGFVGLVVRGRSQNGGGR